MPKHHAQRLAEHLIAHADVDPLIVEIPDDGYEEKVAQALEELGYRVDRDPFRPRLTIHQKRIA